MSSPVGGTPFLLEGHSKFKETPPRLGCCSVSCVLFAARYFYAPSLKRRLQIIGMMAEGAGMHPARACLPRG